MGNPHKGEISFEHEGKLYTVAFDFYAQALLQRQTKVPTERFFSRPMDQWGADDLLQLLWSGLFRRHKMTEEAVADMVDALGMERVGTILADAIQAATARTGGGNGSLPPQAAEVLPTSASSSSNGSP